VHRGRCAENVRRSCGNIDFRALTRMRWPLLHRMKPGGYLVVSGLLAVEEKALRKRYLDTGQLQFKEIKRQGEWACLTLRRKGVKYDKVLCAPAPHRKGRCGSKEARYDISEGYFGSIQEMRLPSSMVRGMSIKGGLPSCNPLQFSSK